MSTIDHCLGIGLNLVNGVNVLLPREDDTDIYV